MIRNTIILAVLSGAIPLLAQDQPSQRPATEKSSQELKVSEQEAKHQVTDANKGSKLIGMAVKNKQDEDLGKIKDLVIDFQSGKVAYAVLSSGGTFGIGGKMVAVPFEALTPQPGQKALLLDLPKQQLTQAQGFMDENWPDLDAAQKGQTIGLGAQGGTGSAQSTESSAGQQPGQQKDEQPKDRRQKE